MIDLRDFHGWCQGVLLTKGRGWAEERLTLRVRDRAPEPPHPCWIKLGCGVAWAIFSDRGAYAQGDGRLAGVSWMPGERAMGQPVLTVPIGPRDDPDDLFAIDPVPPMSAGLLSGGGAGCSGVLGGWQMAELAEGGKRVRLHWSPIDWIRQGGGMDRLEVPELAEEPPRLCVVDWETWDARTLLDQAGELVCDDEDHAAAVAGILAAHRKRKLGPKPALMVVDPSREREAA